MRKNHEEYDSDGSSEFAMPAAVIEAIGLSSATSC